MGPSNQCWRQPWAPKAEWVVPVGLTLLIIAVIERRLLPGGDEGTVSFAREFAIEVRPSGPHQRRVREEIHGGQSQHFRRHHHAALADAHAARGRSLPRVRRHSGHKGCRREPYGGYRPAHVAYIS